LLAQALAPTSGADVFKLGRILVPTDFSGVSRKAIRYARAFAVQFKARLTLLHVLPPVYLPGSEFGPMDLAMAEAELRSPDMRVASLEQLRALAGVEVGTAVPVEVEVREGQPMQEIVELAREIEADLIVLTTHGRTGLKHMLLGSVAENVVRHAPCPVFVVRECEHEFVEGAKQPPAKKSAGKGGGKS
jgi:nucleotide-binding universal stress UspA family protein